MKIYTSEWWGYLTSNSKYQGLDLLRAIAIVMVLVWHNVPRDFRVGWVGVDLFFILSGFLIGSILFGSMSTGRFDYRYYMVNRILRIYPLYIVAVIFYVVDLICLGGLDSLTEALQIFLAHSVFLQTIVYDIWHIDLPFYPVTWSLVVEMVFYVTAPVLIFLMTRYRIVWPGLAIVSLLFLCLRYYLSSGYAADDTNWQYYLFLKPYYRYDELLFGVAIAYAVSENINSFRGLALSVGAIIISGTLLYIWMLPGADKHPSMGLLTRDGVLMPTVLSIGFSLIVYALYDKKVSSVVVNIVARLAYPLYLFHALVLHQYEGLAGYIILCFFAAVACSYFVEYPFIRMYKNNNVHSLKYAAKPT